MVLALEVADKASAAAWSSPAWRLVVMRKTLAVLEHLQAERFGWSSDLASWTLNRYLRRMTDKIIDAVGAQDMQAYAARTYRLSGWIVMQDQPGYPGKVIARLSAGTPTPYVLLADTLAEIHAALPAGLVRSDRQPSDPPEVVEIWLSV
jgi:hypothetical protein